MKKSICRLWGLAAFLGLCFSCVALLPEPGDMKSSMLSTKLPDKINDLIGKEVKVSEKELRILAKDTDFERKVYYNQFDRSRVPVEVSIVFSGKDMNNSIHRPEVCLRAQGWNFIEESFVEIETSSELIPKLPVKRIICEKPLYRENEALLNAEGKPVIVRRISYYTFYGHKKVVAGHFERVWEDIKDRLFKGYDQRWAYATFSSDLIDVREVDGKIIEIEKPVEACEIELQKVIKFVMSKSINLEK